MKTSGILTIIGWIGLVIYFILGLTVEPSLVMPIMFVFIISCFILSMILNRKGEKCNDLERKADG